MIIVDMNDEIVMEREAELCKAHNLDCDKL